ncbi:protein jagunal homolog 1 isoform X2 [Capsicum annuum]|uniref:protein jagunal homolog 1 isoform X2 n=1 Tax=Capsicum annuum TaxID=4072 RepID=UPI0007BF8A3D|nr:protein jagunal homolog 1 isoform X2 [Capsicum annuum]
MNQRTAIRGRPSGTDGSDFSYRMVVDSRYTKVAKAKSRLAKLIFSQVVTQLMIAANVFVSLSKNESPDRISVSSLVIGFVSIVAGELGRKKSRSSFLKFYVVGSSMAILLSVAYLAMSNLQLEDFWYNYLQLVQPFLLLKTWHLLRGLLDYQCNSVVTPNVFD